MKILSVQDGHCNIRLYPKNHLTAVARLLASPLVTKLSGVHDRRDIERPWEKNEVVIVLAHGQLRSRRAELMPKELSCTLHAPPGIGMSRTDFEAVIKVLEADIPEFA